MDTRTDEERMDTRTDERQMYTNITHTADYIKVGSLLVLVPSKQKIFYKNAPFISYGVI